MNLLKRMGLGTRTTKPSSCRHEIWMMGLLDNEIVWQYLLAALSRDRLKTGFTFSKRKRKWHRKRTHLLRKKESENENKYFKWEHFQHWLDVDVTKWVDGSMWSNDCHAQIRTNVRSGTHYGLGWWDRSQGGEDIEVTMQMTSIVHTSWTSSEGPLMIVDNCDCGSAHCELVAALIKSIWTRRCDFQPRKKDNTKIQLWLKTKTDKTVKTSFSVPKTKTEFRSVSSIDAVHNCDRLTDRHIPCYV